MIGISVGWIATLGFDYLDFVSVFCVQEDSILGAHPQGYTGRRQFVFKLGGSQFPGLKYRNSSHKHLRERAHVSPWSR